MATMATHGKGRGGALLWALLACWLPAAAQEPAPPEPAPASSGHWPWPTIRVGGTLSYDYRRDRAEQQEHIQNALAATLNLATSTYLWEPWFARVDGALGITTTRDSGKTYENELEKPNASRSVIMTGALRLSVLAQSRYPFEAHYDRNDSRVGNAALQSSAYASERFGFTQHYLRPEGDSMFGWDHNTQSSVPNGRDLQDSMQLNLTETLGPHRLQLLGNAARNVHEASGESTRQDNLSLQHSYAPAPELSVENMANFSRAGYHLLQGDSRTGLAQLSSLALWHPDEQDWTGTAGVRLFALGIDTSGRALDANANAARARNANANLGVNYELSPQARLTASANVNVIENGGLRSSNGTETVGASYQPASLHWDKLHYGWSASVVGANRSGGAEAGRQLTAQLGHNIGRSQALGDAAALAVDFNQGITEVVIRNRAGAPDANSRQLTHGATFSLETAGERGNAMLRLSASDARNTGDKKEYFQMVNLQLVSNLTSGVFSSWSGNLTVQAVRQGVAAAAGQAALEAQFGKSFAPTSSAALSYQNQRLFGVRQLRFTSAVRLGGQSLLPVLGSGHEQETAAWDNRLDYMIGRTQLRINALVARSSTVYSGSLAPIAGSPEPRALKTSRTIVFSLSRGFGNF
ncbi:MAG: hypothetical protein V4508_06385 [Pseudomonadota bacterium]